MLTKTYKFLQLRCIFNKIETASSAVWTQDLLQTLTTDGEFYCQNSILTQCDRAQPRDSLGGKHSDMELDIDSV